MIGAEVQNLSTIFANFGRLLAQSNADDSWAFLGEDSLAWLVLAFGAAMVVGNVLAVLRPPADQTSRAPLSRTVVMITVGAIAAIWGLASILR